MIPSRQKFIRSVVPLLVFSISQVYIQASLTTRGAQAQDQGSTPMVGRLEIHGKNQILVDSNGVESGATILDAQTLETPNCASGTVHLLLSNNEIGEVELAANSKAVINFSAGKVKVTLMSGCARVRTALNIDATIDTPDGASMPAAQDTADSKRAEVCYPSGERRDFTPSCGASPVVNGAGVNGAIGNVAIVVGAVVPLALTYINPCSRAQDTSTNIPTSQCQ
jgi:hypothetical protein